MSFAYEAAKKVNDLQVQLALALQEKEERDSQKYEEQEDESLNLVRDWGLSIGLRNDIHISSNISAKTQKDVKERLNDVPTSLSFSFMVLSVVTKDVALLRAPTTVVVYQNLLCDHLAPLPIHQGAGGPT